MQQHPTMEVMCHVSNCKYYENDYCYAPKLEVNPKGMTNSTASSSDEALCTTFRPR